MKLGDRRLARHTLSHSQATRAKLRTLVLANRADLGCHSVTGDGDYLIKVRLADLGA